MAREIIEGTAHHFNWVQVGVVVSHPEAGKMLDMSDAVNNELGMTDASVKIVPYNGYGDSRLIRQLLEIEKPDCHSSLHRPQILDLVISNRTRNPSKDSDVLLRYLG